MADLDARKEDPIQRQRGDSQQALTHNADAPNDLLTNTRTARESIQHMAIIGAVMSHLQITRLQFDLDIPWPPLLLAVMRSVTWPFVSSM